MTVDLMTEPPASLGVMPCRARLYQGAPGQFDEFYLYVPPGRDQLQLHTYASKVIVFDQTGGEVGPQDAQSQLKVRPHSVYRLGVKFEWEMSAFGLTGIPPILCPE